MTRDPITHRVTPRVADAWIAGSARPPGDGFEKLRNHHRSQNIKFVVRYVMFCLAVCALSFAAGWWL
jgi:hypothetical protein